jgi:diguanylate cyclase (GGDEF)-like protein
MYDFKRDVRVRSAQRRRQTALRRIEAAAARDAVAHERDLAALARDQAAALRDRELTSRDAAEALAEVRARAGDDREQAGRDREHAARDRVEAQADREALLRQLAIAETDALTGTRTRAAGLAELDHEIDRARRTTGLLVVAYVDVVGLKAVNDEHGHAAGDALLQHAVRAIRRHLRSYDLIIRVGGDEFLCVMSGATIQDARQRFEAVQAGLAADVDPSEIKVGFAELAPEEGVAELIERADGELLANER